MEDRRRRRALAPVLLLLCLIAITAAGCGAIPFEERPASAYVYGSGSPLRVAVVDETVGDDWAPAIARAVRRYDEGSRWLEFTDTATGAHIVVTMRRYSDTAPPALQGYVFQTAVGGFAAVYDADGSACNFPPSALPLGCSGEIARAEVYLNDIIPPGDDIEARRERLIVHELGHALGLTRHSAELGIEQLARRYGWPAE